MSCGNAWLLRLRGHLLRWHSKCRLVEGPICGLLVYICARSSGDRQGLTPVMCRMMGLAVFMVVWWLNGAVRMGITGLMPVFFLPLLGITSGRVIAGIYFSDGVVVFWGSMLMAGAVEKYGLHERIARGMLYWTRGTGASGILAGFISVTAFMSMWLSNTATVVLMVPLSNAIITQLQHSQRQSASIASYDYVEMTDEQLQKLGCAIDLGVAYASTLGGMATITGTGSNIALQGALMALFGAEGEVTFLTWLSFSLPLVAVNLVILTLVLLKVFVWRWNSSALCKKCCLKRSYATVITRTGEQQLPANELEDSGENHIIEMAVRQGPNEASTTALQGEADSTLSYPEIVVMTVFALMGVLWLTRDPPGGWGWGHLFPHPYYITDGTVAILSCFLLFVTPAQPPSFLQHLLLRISRNSSPPSSTSLSIIDGSSAAPPMHISSSREYTFIDDCDSKIDSEQFESAKKFQTSPVVEELQQSNRYSLPLQESSPPVSRRHHGGFVLQWEAVSALNWDVIFLLGGGFALSKGFADAGLSRWISQCIVASGPSSIDALIASTSILTCAATNIMSNVAAANILLPSLACVAPQHRLAPLAVLMPITMASSLALLFPIGTPPNAIVISNGRVNTWQMLVVGGVCTVLCLSLIIVYGIFLFPLLYDVHNVSASVLNTCQ